MGRKYDFCPKCRKYDVTDGSHRCPPAWIVWLGDEAESDGSMARIHAATPDDAVEKWAKWFDSLGDYIIISGEPTKVRVRPVEGNEVQEYVVTGESVPEYNAQLVVRKEEPK